ncbi:MAG: hypothetical protein JWO79_1863, partial [Actinomycetia bacterium]|nr:hypothetical protein [Actinomycetes bacterium]
MELTHQAPTDGRAPSPKCGNCDRPGPV